MLIHFRKAKQTDFQLIWNIILYAKEVRRKEKSNQWQDGYPNETTILTDIEKGYGYIVEYQDSIVGYFAVIFDKEPAYEAIEGTWLSQRDYTVIHRLAVSKEGKGKGLGRLILQKVEELSLANNIFSIRIDTNFDNVPMLKIIDSLGYTYCGEVKFRGSYRKAFEKLL